MFDRDRLFRVLFHLSTENNAFLVAQDAYETIRSCIHQIRDASIGLSEMKERLKLLDESEEYTTQREQIQSCIERYEEVQRHEESWISFLNPLLEEAREFWFCCPVDHTHCVGENKSPVERWRVYKEAAISEELIVGIRSFKDHCVVAIDNHFPDLLIILQEEVDRERLTLSSLSSTSCKLYNEIPIVILPQFSKVLNSFMTSTLYPRTHYHSVDDNFVVFLGISIGRVLAFPLKKQICNFSENPTLSQPSDNVPVRNPKCVRLLYRIANGHVSGVLWAIGRHPLDKIDYSIGVDITPELEAFQFKQVLSIQKMLKQWLHNIRNASFEQQARVILEEVQNLEKKVHRSELQGEFESISECVKLLIHTAKTSVGLIGQALETRGLTQQMCVSDFASNITSFPHHFAQSEGIPAIYTRYRFYLNGNPASPQDYSSFFVTGDIISLQSIVDNIISNAVRYTDPVLGISVDLYVVSLQSDRLVEFPMKFKFTIDIIDHAPGGLPNDVWNLLKSHLGSEKCVDTRAYIKIENQISVGKGRSSKTGLPHLLELYHQLVRSGETGFDLSVLTQESGSTFKIRFLMNSADTSTLLHMTTSSEMTKELNNKYAGLGTILVVDDSMVIRKMISRYLQTFQCTHKVCSNGAEAWDWFVANHSHCAGVITDLEMPKMGGDALIAKVHELCPEKPCFIVSGNDIPPNKLPQGVIRAILKPVAIEQIESMLHEISSRIHCSTLA